TDESRILETIDDIEKAIEARSALGVEPYISQRYHDGDGLAKREVVGLLYAELRGSPDGIGIQHLGRTQVDLRGTEHDRHRTATATFRAAVRRKGGSILGDTDVWDIEVDLAKEEGTWRVTSHRRKPAGQ